MDALRKLGAVVLFLGRDPRAVSGVLLPGPGTDFGEQVHNAGVLSLVIIMTSAFFVGMVIGLQGYDSLARVCARKTYSVRVWH
jgi:ABC-type transporter Mla maintaining outer membrane lipid asymmetry permease subunit MlaE